MNISRFSSALVITKRQKNDNNLKKKLICNFLGVCAEHSVLVAQKPAFLFIMKLLEQKSKLQSNEYILSFLWKST